MNPHTSRLRPDGTIFPPVTPDPPPPPGYVDPLEGLEDPPAAREALQRAPDDQPTEQLDEPRSGGQAGPGG